MKNIFIIGPTTGIENNNVLAFQDAESFYQRRGYSVTTPITVNYMFEIQRELHGAKTTKLDRDIYFQKLLTKHADVVVMLEDSQNSKEVNLLLFVCIQHNIPVIEAITDNPLTIRSDVSVDYTESPEDSDPYTPTSEDIILPEPIHINYEHTK